MTRRGTAVSDTETKGAAQPHPVTPDGRYFVVRGRLWRMADPSLAEDVRGTLVRRLMAARRALRGHGTEEERAAARGEVQRTKEALGERGPVWWTDGAPDENRKLVRNSSYAAWGRSAGVAEAPTPGAGRKARAR